MCARLLALSSDELWLVSPETAKLLALKHDIERENPRAELHLAATPNGHLGDMDVIEVGHVEAALLTLGLAKRG